MGGTKLLITGENFPSDLSCRFGSAAPRPARWISSLVVECVTPAHHPGAVQLHLASHYTSSSHGGLSFTFVNQWSVSSASPPLGSTTGGTPIYIRGTGFIATAVTHCRFGDASVDQAVFINSTAILCTSPAGKAGMVSVGISLNGNDFASGGYIFQYVLPPTVAGLLPALGWSGNAVTVVISGSNFVPNMWCRLGSGTSSNQPSNLMQRQLTDASSPETSGAQAATTWSKATFVSTTSVSCALPAVSRLGSSLVQLSSNMVDVETSSLAFIHMPKPVVHAVQPQLGPSTGGTTVYINAQHLSTATSFFVRFAKDGETNTATAVRAVLVTKAILACKSPGLSPGKVSLSGKSSAKRFLRT